MTGSISNIVRAKGFFFITVQGVSYFAHRSMLRNGLAFEQLQEGDVVEFEPANAAPKGPRAERVTGVERSA